MINHEATFAAMREVYDRSTTRNIAKSLETGGARSSRIPDGGADTGAEGSRGPVPAGDKEGMNIYLPLLKLVEEAGSIKNVEELVQGAMTSRNN